MKNDIVIGRRIETANRLCACGRFTETVYNQLMPTEAALRRAISGAESILPGRPAHAGERDRRWQAIIRVGEFIESHPETVCDFALKWMKRGGADLQSAISCCLIEHLLEHHFDLLFPRFRRAAIANSRVADHFVDYSPLFKFGQAELPKNVARLKRLARDLRRQREAKGATKGRAN
jgi:hypothetical protein